MQYDTIQYKILYMTLKPDS